MEVEKWQTKTKSFGNLRARISPEAEGEIVSLPEGKEATKICRNRINEDSNLYERGWKHAERGKRFLSHNGSCHPNDSMGKDPLNLQVQGDMPSVLEYSL